MILRKIATSLLLCTLPAAAGDVVGHAIVTKKLSRKKLAPLVYNLRGAVPAMTPVGTDSVNEFDQMVMILEGGSGPANSPVTVVLDQRNSRFDRDVLVIPVGSSVEFPNSDPIFHNVFSLSKAQPFDLGFYPQGQSRTVRFNRAGVVQVYCHIHANMYAAIVVTASPWYARPSADGSFAWTDVPAGHYRLTAWHKVAGLRAINIDVPESGKVDATVHVPLDTEPPR
jgi:plastocyanin